MRRSQSADVVVVGAGVIGCAIARELAFRGMSVIVVERHSSGRGATWAAAGMLSPLGEAGGAAPFLELADASLAQFGSFAEALQDETGIDVEYRTTGKLHVSLGDADVELAALAAGPLAQRFEVSSLSVAAARRLEPSLSGRVTGAVLVGRDHRVNNRLLAQALLAAATREGATFRTRNPVLALVTKSGHAAGVRLASGEEIETGTVVLAAGAWSGQIAGLPRELPLAPIKGQMFSVDARDRASGRPSHAAPTRVIFARSCYIVPRDDGRLLVGATVEDVGFSEGPTPRGVAGLVAAASALVPMIDDLPLVETWAGFRPATPDHLPVLGPDPDVSGLCYATGHFRNGILLAPITAAVISAIVSGRPTPVEIGAFDIRRFDS